MHIGKDYGLNLYKLELYKLCCTKDNDYEMDLVDELGWINDKEFCVWVPYYNINEFMDGLKKIFGYGIFDDGRFYANMQSDCVCIDLCDALGGYIDIETVFPKDKYKH